MRKKSKEVPVAKETKKYKSKHCDNYVSIVEQDDKNIILQGHVGIFCVSPAFFAEHFEEV